MASKVKIKVNGLVHSVTASLDTPLLYVLHNELHLHGPRFGCGLAQCGACSVLLDGKEIRSCVTPVAAVSGKAITTLEGLPALWAKERGTAAASPALHPQQPGRPWPATTPTPRRSIRGWWSTPTTRSSSGRRRWRRGTASRRASSRSLPRSSTTTSQ